MAQETRCPPSGHWPPICGSTGARCGRPSTSWSETAWSPDAPTAARQSAGRPTRATRGTRPQIAPPDLGLKSDRPDHVARRRTAGTCRLLAAADLLGHEPGADEARIPRGVSGSGRRTDRRRRKRSRRGRPNTCATSGIRASAGRCSIPTPTARTTIWCARSAARVPLVLLDRKMSGTSMSTSWASRITGRCSRQPSHLIAQGHRRIAHITRMRADPVGPGSGSGIPGCHAGRGRAPGTDEMS